MKKRWWLIGLLVGVLVVAGLWMWRSEHGLPEDVGNETLKTVMDYADAHQIPYSAYPKSLIRLMARNPETQTFVLEYPQRKGTSQPVDLSEYADSDAVPLLMQWDPRWGYMNYGSDVAGLTGCGPVCLSMAAYYVTKDLRMSPDKIISFAVEEGYCVPGNGSSWTLISEGGPKLGLQVQELPLDKGRIVQALEDRKPVICVMGPGDFTDSGHYIVIVGVQDGLFLINDPNSRSNSEKLWAYEDICDQIRNLWSIGPS